MIEAHAVVKIADVRVDVWKCHGCLRWRPFCDGGSDEFTHLCDGCWFIATHRPSLWERLVRFVRLLFGWIDEGHGCSECKPVLGRINAGLGVTS